LFNFDGEYAPTSCSGVLAGGSHGQENAPASRVKPEVVAVAFVQAMDRTDDSEVVKRSFQAVIEELGFASVTCATLPITGISIRGAC